MQILSKFYNLVNIFFAWKFSTFWFNELFSGLLIYRIFRYNTKKSLKLAHAFIMVLALFFAILSNLPLTDPPHFYTLHAWIGYAAYALFIFQVICKSFLFMQFTTKYEKMRLGDIRFDLIAFSVVCRFYNLSFPWTRCMCKEGLHASPHYIWNLNLCFGMCCLLDRNNWKTCPDI